MGRKRLIQALRGFSLVELLVAVLAVALIGGWFAYRYAGSAPTGKADAPTTRARSMVCQENLHNVRLAIQTAQMSDPGGKYPRSLEDLHLPQDVLQCDVGHEPYSYDPATGRVSCVHPGHEDY